LISAHTTTSEDPTSTSTKFNESILCSNDDLSSTVVSSVDTQNIGLTDQPWAVVVWNDPINLMSYVTYVFQKLFGYSKEKATKLMLDVHNKGRAVVSQGTRERAEMDVYRLHVHGLWATLEKSS
jgi:ATP-dependent Clp protease adaptor protein ClpS